MKNIKYLILCLFCIVNFIVKGQPIYTVNETSMGIGTPGSGTSGSLDIMMQNAMLYANAGNHATVKLSAAGLINLAVALPSVVVTSPSGKLTILKDPAAMDQGIVASGYDSYGFKIEGCVGDVEIKELKIDNFNKGVFINGSGSSSTTIFTIEGNSILNCENGIFYSSGSTTIENLTVINNVITGETGFSTVPDYDGIDIALDPSFTNNFSGFLLKIEGNIISNYYNGIRVKNYETDVERVFIVKINGNSISICRDGINCWDPKKAYWQISNNILSDISYRGIVMKKLVGTIHEIDFNFIDPDNTLGLPVENHGNEFYECYHSIELIDMDEMNIIGLKEMGGGIFGGTNKPYTIRECLFQKPVSIYPVLQPISWSYGTNDNIQPPAPTFTESYGTTLTVDYSTVGLNSSNAPFVVEFFEAADDHSVLQFIGSETLLTGDPGPYSKTFTDFSPTTGTKIGMTVTSVGSGAPGASDKIGTSVFAFIDLNQIPCDTCNTFALTAGKKYWISAWVQEENSDEVKTYDQASLELDFITNEESFNEGFSPSGIIIDGWQRIVGSFVVPEDVYEMQVHLKAHDSKITYFDDIRIHPFNGSMKSYVYDGETFWLSSELDDNNYATFYEYDEEGGLVRIKKETARGIVTIQETRSNTQKVNNIID